MPNGLTPQTARDLCNGKYSDRQIRRACEKGATGQFGGIEGAEKHGTTWWFSVESWNKWVDTPEFHKTGKKAAR